MITHYSGSTEYPAQQVFNFLSVRPSVCSQGHRG